MGAERLPFEYIYGALRGNPTSPRLRHTPSSSREPFPSPFCNVTAEALQYHRTGCPAGEGVGCPEGRTGPFCEGHKRSYCLRDCSNRGWCDAGFCWCERGWFGVDCSQSSVTSLQSSGPLPDGGSAGGRGTSIAPSVLMPSLQARLLRLLRRLRR